MDIDASELVELSQDIQAATTTTLQKIRQVVVKATADTKRDAMIKAPVDTGFLRSSISGTTVHRAGYSEGTVGASANYAPYVEFGTSRAAPQPFLGPALERNQPLMEQAFANIFDEFL